MSKPRILDLFCGAGGATKGYQLAGFHVTGVDIAPQPHYCGDEFHQADALTFPLGGFDAIHASPPTTPTAASRPCIPGREWVRLIEPTRERLLESGLPFVMELGACGDELRRHRRFESNLLLTQPPCRHRLRTIGVYEHGGHSGKHRMANAEDAATALGIDWMTRDELAQAIPPAYTEWIGLHLLVAVQRNAV